MQDSVTPGQPPVPPTSGRPPPSHPPQPMPSSQPFNSTPGNNYIHASYGQTGQPQHPGTATTATPPPPQHSPPTLQLPSATYGSTPGGPGATPPNPQNNNIDQPQQQAQQQAQQNVHMFFQPQQPQQPHQQQYGYPPPPYGMMPHQPLNGAPLSPAFNNEGSGPPVGTTPGTPNMPNGHPSYPQGNIPGQPNMPPQMPMPPQHMMSQMAPPHLGGHPAPMYMQPMYQSTPGMLPPYMSQQPPMMDPNQQAHGPQQQFLPQQPTLGSNGIHNSIIAGNMPPIYPTQPSTAMPPRMDLKPRDRIVHQEIKLEILCKNLRDRDIASKSDPTCVVFLEQRNYTPYGAYASFYPSSAGEEFQTSNNSNSNSNGASGSNNHNNSAALADSYIKWKEVERTECIKNCLSPHFKVQITVPYHFEQLQHIRLGLWDIDSKKADLSTHDFLGDVRTTVAELVMAGVWESPLTSPNRKDLKRSFGGKRDLGTITVIVHESRDGGNMLIKVAMSAKKLDRKDFWISSDPYFIVSQLGKNAASRSQLYKSEVIRRSINPVWRPFQFKVAIPKGGGKSDIKLEFLVYDKDNHRRDDEIGKAVHSLEDVEKTQSVPVLNEHKKIRRRNYKNSGMIEFSKFEVISMPSLVDYLQGGLKLHFSVAVDLTASNGNPAEPMSLHYQDYYGNRYTRAIRAIADVLHVYCHSDNLFAAFGFGAELPGNPGYTSSCFPLGLGGDPMVNGVHGVLEAYVRSLHSVRLSGPTNFAPLIETVSRTAAQRINTQTDQNYDVLLILTDGVVSDFDLTVERIISASRSAPLSIIIIGIGNRNFRKMKELDSDDSLLTSADGMRQAVRDICQFVDFSEYERSPPERLGAAVLAELPGNIVEYFVGNCNPPILPGQRPERPSVA